MRACEFPRESKNDMRTRLLYGCSRVKGYYMEIVISYAIRLIIYRLSRFFLLQLFNWFVVVVVVVVGVVVVVVIKPLF